ncbi:MAG: hypothetical protein PHR16_17380 [Methylovulum sp.]|nr:hypothetical protein [Methylovulum sp.]
MGGTSLGGAGASCQTQPKERQTVRCSCVPVSTRLVVSRILDEDGDVLAQWLLLTNVKDVDAATIVLWYCYCWRLQGTRANRVLFQTGQIGNYQF